MYEGVEPFQTDRPRDPELWATRQLQAVGSVIEAMTHVDGGAELVIWTDRSRRVRDCAL